MHRLFRQQFHVQLYNRHFIIFSKQSMHTNKQTLNRSILRCRGAKASRTNAIKTGTNFQHTHTYDFHTINSDIERFQTTMSKKITIRSKCVVYGYSYVIDLNNKFAPYNSFTLFIFNTLRTRTSTIVIYRRTRIIFKCK
jgi:hypothetical protein